jgi:hypothetical protein
MKAIDQHMVIFAMVNPVEATSDRIFMHIG